MLSRRPAVPLRVLLAPMVQLTQDLVDQIASSALAIEVASERATTPVELSRLLARQPFDVAFTTFLPSERVGPPNLRWIQLSSAGVDSATTSPLWLAEGVEITTSNGIHATAMSQWTMSMVLHNAQRLDFTLAYKSSRRWPSVNDHAQLSAQVLAGKTLGIVGFGSVGRECARIGRALGMTILAISRSRGGGPGQRERYLPPSLSTRSPSDGLVEELSPEQLPRLLSQADYIVLTVPLTPETRGMIGSSELALMKESAFLINASRGAIIDERALVRALDARQIAGVALDVYETEPLATNSPLFDLPNAVLSPHVSGLFEGYWDAALDLFRANLVRFLRNQPLVNTVDRRLGY